MLALFDTLLRPTRRLGLNPAQISLALSMTIRFIPEIRTQYLAIREAQFARGLHNSPVAVLVPLLVRTLEAAQEILVLAGLPLLAGGRGGFGVLLGPTGGYLLGWIPAALVIGFLVQRWGLRQTRPGFRFAAVLLSVVIGGIGVINALGVPWTAVVTGLPLSTSLLGSLVFVPGDLLKAVVATAVVATAVALNVHRSYRRLLGGVQTAER